MTLFHVVGLITCLFSWIILVHTSIRCLVIVVVLVAGSCTTAFSAPQSDVPDTVDNDSVATGDSSTDVPIGLLAGYCALIIAASMIGGMLPFWLNLTHTRMQTMISFVGGLMLGIGFFHMMPHAIQELHSAQKTAQWMMVGIIMMFVMLRLFHFHNHEPVRPASSSCGHDHDSDHPSTGESHSPADCHTHGHAHGISWTGIAFGLSVHTLIDGLALGASVDAGGASGWLGLAGVGTFLAVLLHKPLDAVSISALMVAGGHSRRRIHLVNTGFALMCPLGAFLFVLGVRQFTGYEQELLGTALAFSAGVFICIALSDLLPEMEFHSHNRVQLTLALALGIAFSWGLMQLSGHVH